MKKTVLITGGAGFIGSHLCDRFLGMGWKVVCVDNLQTGNYNNIAVWENVPDFTFIQANVTHGIPYTHKVDAVLHFASPASPVAYTTRPLSTMMVNSMGTKVALALAYQNRAKFLFASTSEVYGDPLIHPQREDYYGNVNSIGPRSMYDEAKRFGEALTMVAYNKLGLDTKIIRIFNTYGPRMQADDGRVIPALIKAGLKDKPMPINGDGSQTRSFCFVTDLVDGIVSLLDVNYHLPVNLGNPEEVSILELATIIRDKIPSRSCYHYEPISEDDPKKRRPDITKAESLLDWCPKVSLSDGLDKTIQYFANLGVSHE